MPRKSKTHTEGETTVATEITDETEFGEETEVNDELPEDPSAVREMIKRMREERNAKNAAARKARDGEKALREHLKSLKASKPARTGAPSSARTLDSVVAQQTAFPKRYLIQQVFLAANARHKVGQSLAEALQGVFEFYGEIVLSIADDVAENKTPLGQAIDSWLQVNAPEAYALNQTRSKSTSDSADEE